MKHLLLCLSLIGCAKPTHIDANLISYVNDFQTTFGVNIDGLSVKFESLTMPTIGECEMLDTAVSIDPTFWMGASEIERQALMFHELGHCIFLRFHTKDLMPDGCPTSLMYPIMPWEYCLLTHRSEYENELAAVR